MGTAAFCPDLLTELPFGLPGRIYRSPMPYGEHDPAGKLLACYRLADIQAVVLLADDEEIWERTGRRLRHLYAGEGLEIIWLPIPDFGVPDLEALHQAVLRAWGCARAGKNLVVHCGAGIGRTGLFLACLAQCVFTIGGEESVAWVRRFIPGALETPEQLLLAEAYGVQVC